MIKILPFLLITCLIIGCGGYKMQDLQIALEAGEPEKAYTNLQKNAPKKPDIPFLFEFGLVAHYANHFPESNARRSIKQEISLRTVTPKVFQKRLFRSPPPTNCVHILGPDMNDF